MQVINEEEFNKIKNQTKELFLVDFFATWCAPCRMLTEELEQAMEQEKINIYKVNIDEEEKLARSFGILSIPTVIAFKNGEEQDKFIGYRNKDEICEFIDKLK